jgi:XTP/dITP diphosphohydrolase
MKKLLIATNNPGKLYEISDLLKDFSFKLMSPKDLGIDLDVEEVGGTYEENARLKALAFMQASKLASLADDTGLEVEALGGAPGLHSKRYSPQPNATDSDRRQLLINNLETYPHPWTARFVCSVALALPEGNVQIANGICEGEIIPGERGTQGFGYDSIFYFPEIGKTMAELDLIEKNRISHRARAVNNILFAIRNYINAS